MHNEGNEFEEVKSEIAQFSKERDWDQFHNGKDLAIALQGEATELLQAYLWKNGEGAPLEKVKEELADVFNYAFLIADHYNLDVRQIIEDKIKVNAEKYPVDKAYGRAEKYTELKDANDTYNVLYELSGSRISLPVNSDEKAVDSGSIWRTVLNLVKQTIDMGLNPYEQARWSDVHNPDDYFDLPMPENEEDMSDGLNEQKLTDWIMNTDEMHYALMRFKDVNPLQFGTYDGVSVEHLDEESSEELTIEELLSAITVVEN